MYHDRNCYENFEDDMSTFVEETNEECYKLYKWVDDIVEVQAYRILSYLMCLFFLRFFTSTPAAEQVLYVFDVYYTPPIEAGLYQMGYTEQCPESDN